jgi:putative transposase
MFRPVGHPRYGSEAERFFGQYKDLWLSARSGNLVNLKEVRAVSASHRPEKLATMSLLDIWQDLLEFNNWMSHRATGSELSCPATRMRNGMAAFSCSGIPTAYDDNFVIASAVDVGEYKLDRHRGLHIGPFHYWTPELASETKARLKVRDDPQDPYRVYALTHDVWTTCLASPAPSYAKLTPLQQIVEGVFQLDRSEFDQAVRDDADRLFVQAIQRREAAPSMPLQAPQCVEGPPAETDLFDATDSGALPELVEATW